MGALLHLVQWGRAWAGCGPAKSPPPLLAVGLPNVTAHPSTASIPTSYCSIWHYNYQCPLKGLRASELEEEGRGRFHGVLVKNDERDLKSFKIELSRDRQTDPHPQTLLKTVPPSLRYHWAAMTDKQTHIHRHYWKQYHLRYAITGRVVTSTARHNILAQLAVLIFKIAVKYDCIAWFWHLANNVKADINRPRPSGIYLGRNLTPAIA